jgi:hypothetical protein
MKYFCNIPILPIKTDKLYFPEGEIEGLYWFEEIELIIEMVAKKYIKLEYLDVKYGW